VVLENDQGEILLQRRGDVVSYPGLWNDSASGHVDVGETYLEAALRETKEEIGVSGVSLVELGKHYGEEKEGSRIRKAFNMLYCGVFNGTPVIDPSEVSEAAWFSRDEVARLIKEKPDDFTPGSRDALKIFFKSN
jgi:ADP-ribose pyrophosphatase YjhB (NUDIX family)